MHFQPRLSPSLMFISFCSFLVTFADIAANTRTATFESKEARPVESDPWTVNDQLENVDERLMSGWERYWYQGSWVKLISCMFTLIVPIALPSSYSRLFTFASRFMRLVGSVEDVIAYDVDTDKENDMSCNMDVDCGPIADVCASVVDVATDDAVDALICDDRTQFDGDDYATTANIDNVGVVNDEVSFGTAVIDDDCTRVGRIVLIDITSRSPLTSAGAVASSFIRKEGLTVDLLGLRTVVVRGFIKFRSSMGRERLPNYRIDIYPDGTPGFGITFALSDKRGVSTTMTISINEFRFEDADGYILGFGNEIEDLRTQGDDEYDLFMKGVAGELLDHIEQSLSLSRKEDGSHFPSAMY